MGHPIAPVLVGHVPDDLVAAVVGEVDVHVGHGDPLGVQESLEQEAVTHGIDVRDPQTVGDERARRRAPPRTDGDPGLPRVVDEVPDHQEVAGEAHLLDDGQLVAEPRLQGVARRGAVPLAQPVARQLLQIGLERVALGHHVLRQVELPEVEREVAALRHGEGVAARLRRLGEDQRHLLRGLHVELLGRELPAARVGQGGARLDAEQRLVGASVAGLQVMRVVGADDRRADGLRDSQRLRGDARLLRDAVGLDLHIVVIAPEDLLVPARRLLRLLEIAARQRPRDLGVQAAGEHEQAVGVPGQQLAVHARLVIEALEVRLRDELDEVLVAGEVAHEDREVVGAFIAPVLRAALRVLARRHVELGAEDRLDPRFLGGEVEIDPAEKVAVVGERDGRELEVLGLLDQLLELGGAVEQAVLRVHVEVDEFGVLHDGAVTRARWWRGACS